MELRTHGGGCCGVKTIDGFSIDPGEAVDPFEADDFCDLLSRGERYYSPARPLETRLQRLDAYLEFLSERNPGGLVEVVLVENDDDEEDVDQSAWFPHLKKRGFKEVARTENSNGGNTIVMFILVMKEG